MSKGRYAEAEVIIRKAEIVNKVRLPENIFEETNADNRGEYIAGLLSILKSPVLVTRTLIFYSNWYVDTYKSMFRSIIDQSVS